VIQVVVVDMCIRQFSASSCGAGNVVIQSADKDSCVWTSARSRHLHGWSRGTASRSLGGQTSYGQSLPKDLSSHFPAGLRHWTGIVCQLTLYYFKKTITYLCRRMPTNCWDNWTVYIKLVSSDAYHFVACYQLGTEIDVSRDVFMQDEVVFIIV